MDNLTINFIDIFLAIIITIILYFIIKNVYLNKNIKNIKNINDINDINDTNYAKDNDSLSKLIEITKSKKRHQRIPNKYFLNMQFHNDYRDILTSINNVAPDQKQLFNMGNIPVKTSYPNINSTIEQIVNTFIIELNNNIKNDIRDVLNINDGWDVSAPQKNIESGWDKQQKLLGLPSSIYNKPAKKNKIYLIKIDKISKQETSAEIKYTFKLILQKKNVNDQIILRVSVIIPFNTKDERKLFDNNNFTSNQSIDMLSNDIIIEEIFIVGFLSNDHMDDIPGPISIYGGNNTDLNNFDNLNINKITTNKEILNELYKKNNEKKYETQQFSNNMDHETAKFHQTLGI